MPPNVTDKPPTGAAPAPGPQCGPEPPAVGPALAPQSASFPESSALAQEPAPFSGSSSPAAEFSAAVYQSAGAAVSLPPADAATLGRSAALFTSAAAGAPAPEMPDEARQFWRWVELTEPALDRLGREAYVRLSEEILPELADSVLSALLTALVEASQEGQLLRDSVAEAARREGWDGRIEREVGSWWHDALNEWVLRDFQMGMLQDQLRSNASPEQLRIDVLLPSKDLGGTLLRVRGHARLGAQDGVEVRVTDVPAVFIGVALDRKRQKSLQRILDNLITNGIKYHNPALPKGERFVELGAELVGGVVRIWVTDNGRGMTPEELSHYGEEGWRSPDVKEAGISGSGIGSGNVIRLVEELGGAFEIRSEKGKGTRAVVAIPLRNLTAPSSSPGAATGGSVPSSSPQGGGTLQGKMALGARGPRTIFGGDFLRGAAILNRSRSFGLLRREASRKMGLLPAIPAHRVLPPPPMMPFVSPMMPLSSFATQSPTMMAR